MYDLQDRKTAQHRTQDTVKVTAVESLCWDTLPEL